MNTASNKSSFGDWLFLLGAVALIVVYFGYENAAALKQWWLTLQATSVPQHAVSASVDGGMGAWLAANWGLALLILAAIIATAKTLLAPRAVAVANGGPVVTYKRPAFVKVKLIR